MSQLNGVDSAIRKLGIFRVLLGSVVYFNSILFRILVGVSGGLSLKGVALVSFLEFLLNLTLEVPTGVLADKFGRVKVAIVGFLLTAGSLLSLFFAVNFSAQVSLSFFFLVLDGILTGIGKPMFSGAVEGFYQDAIIRASEATGTPPNGVTQSFTLSNRYGKYGSTAAVSLAFLILGLFSHSPYVHFSFIIGAAIYLIVAAVLWMDYRKLGDHRSPTARIPLNTLIPRFVANRTLRFATFLNVVVGLVGLIILGYLIVSVGRSVVVTAGNMSMLVYTAAFMFGFVSFGWILKAWILPTLILSVRNFQYLSTLLSVLGLSSLVLFLKWSELPPFLLVGALLLYGCIVQVVCSALKDFATNLILSEVPKADYATSLSLGNMPVYGGIIAYNVYLLILTPGGIPGVTEIFASVSVLCLIAMIGALEFYRIPLSLLLRRRIIVPFSLVLIAFGAHYLRAAESAPMQGERISVAIDGHGKLPYGNSVPPFVAATFNSAVLGHLLTTDRSYELLPGILKYWSWDYTEGCYNLELRSGVRFHNGRLVTAADVEFSIVRGLFSPTGNYYRVHFANLKGIEAVHSGQRFRSGIVSGVKVVDPLHLKMYLSGPSHSFLHNLSYSYLSPVPKEGLRENDFLSWKKAPNGAGPYRVQDVSEEKSLVQLEAMAGTAPSAIDFYTGEAPANTDVVLWHPDAPRPQMVRVMSKHADSVIVLLVNFNHPIGKDETFRKALSVGIDRQAVSQGYDFLTPISEFLPSHFWGRADSRESFDRKQAKKLFATLDERFPQLQTTTYRIPVFLSGTSDEIVSRLEAQLKALGLKVELYRDSTKFRNKFDVDTLLWVTSFAMADVDPILRFGIFRKDSPVQPFVPRSDARFETLYEGASKASTPGLQIESVKRVSRYVFQHKLLVPLVERKAVHWYDPKRIAGLGIQDGGGSFYLERIQIKERISR